MDAELVNCTFMRLRTSGMEVTRVDLDLDNMGFNERVTWRQRLRTAAHNFAIQRSCQMWAMPGLVAQSDDWLIYGSNVGAEQSPVFLKRVPSQEAAEMWIVHHGHQGPLHILGSSRQGS